MTSARPHSWLLVIAASAALLLIGLLLWRQAPDRERDPGEGAVGTTFAKSIEEPAREGLPLAGEDRAPAIAESLAPTRQPAKQPAQTTRPPSKERPATADRAPGISLVARLVRPDGAELKVEAAEIEFRGAAGGTRRLEVKEGSSARCTDLALDVYTVRVHAQGFEHREQVLDFRLNPIQHVDGPGESLLEQRFVLWPTDWIAVVVETSDRRPFSALARDLGFEPMKLFVGAFRVRTRLDPPEELKATHEDDPTLARFRPPPGYKTWEITKSVVGSLELVHSPPLWVGLDVFGKELGWELLSPGQREVVFHLDLAALEERCALVRLRVVDETNRSPVERALVTLRADTSAHRRADLSNVPTGTDGRVELRRIVPGRYELEIVRGESEHQEMIELGIGEERDLGDIALDDAAGFDVLVVDEHEKPMSTYVEIGPYKKGARNGDIYPQMMRHKSDGKGKCRLPMPSNPVIVRAAVDIWRSNGPDSVQELSGVRSANVLLDPRSVPHDPLRLRLQAPVRVHISTKRLEGARIEVLDELDVVVARSVHASDKELDVELVPGRYRARAVAPDATPGLEAPFTVDHEPRRIVAD